MSRHDFLSWLAKGAPVKGLPSRGVPPQADEVLVLRATGPDKDRAVIVLKDAQAQHDFFAFVSTYVSTYVPFSKFFKVITYRDFEGFRELRDYVSDRLFRALVGTIICDAVARPENNGDPNLLRRCLTSESFALAKALVLGKQVDLHQVAQRWAVCTRVISGYVSDKSGSSLEFWLSLERVMRSARQENLFMANSSGAGLPRIIGGMLERGEIPEQVWSDLGEIFPDARDLKQQMSGPREIRARTFTSLVRSDTLHSAGIDADMVVGLLGTMLAGGQLEYARLVSGLHVAFPNAVRWFGFFSGCLDASDVLEFDRSLGRHVLGEISAWSDLGDDVTADISYSELGVVSSSRDGMAAVRTLSSDLIFVELMSGLTMPLARSPARDIAGDSSKEYLDRMEEARSLLRRVDILLDARPRSSNQSDRSRAHKKVKK